jgi:hypothetical protein
MSESRKLFVGLVVHSHAERMEPERRPPFKDSNTGVEGKPSPLVLNSMGSFTRGVGRHQ